MANSANSPSTADGWRTYCEGGQDIAGRTIAQIVAYDETFIIYLTRREDSARVGWWGHSPAALEHHVEGENSARAHLAEANVLIAKIHALSPKRFRNRVNPDRQLIGAYELALRNQVPQAIVILQDVMEQLVAKQTAKGQLFYMMANILGCVITWCGCAYWYHVSKGTEAIGYWVLAGALGASGGVLSVATNLTKININVHQGWFLQSFAGWTRGVVAFLGGVVCLLAIRGKIALSWALPPTADEASLLGMMLTLPEMFFCFLAGFSESLVPNILRDADAEAEAAAAKTRAKAARNPEDPDPIKPPLPAVPTPESPPPPAGAGQAEMQTVPGADLMAEAARMLASAHSDVEFLEHAAGSDPQWIADRDRAREKAASLGIVVDGVTKSIRNLAVASQASPLDSQTTATILTNGRQKLDEAAVLAAEIADSRRRIAGESAQG